MDVLDMIMISKLWDALVAVSALYDKADIVEMKQDINRLLKSNSMNGSTDISLQHILLECDAAPRHVPAIIGGMTVLLDQVSAKVRHEAFDFLNR